MEIYFIIFSTTSHMIWMYQPSFNHSSFDEHLGCLFFPLTNDAASNTPCIYLRSFKGLYLQDKLMVIECDEDFTGTTKWSLTYKRVRNNIIVLCLPFHFLCYCCHKFYLYKWDKAMLHCYHFCLNSLYVLKRFK